MKVCHCRDFNEAAAKAAIENGHPENPEDVHKIVKGVPPKCGACLSLVQALMDRYETDGVVPRVLDVSYAERQAAEEKLAERFTGEEPDRSRAPQFKRRYMPLGDKALKP